MGFELTEKVMETVVETPEINETDIVEPVAEHKVILLPVQNRHTSSTPQPISAERIADLLQAGGYKGSIVETETRRYVESSAEGWKFRVYFFDDGAAKNSHTPTSLMLSAGWGLDQSDIDIISRAANTFNMKFRYLKAYVVNDEEYAYTEAEMSQFCPDGLSDDEFNAFLDMFINLRQSYVSICGEMRKS